MRKIEVNQLEIRVNAKGFISLTDIAKERTGREPRTVIQAWLRNGNTILFLEEWERQNNPNFNRSGFATFRSESIDQTQELTPKRYAEIAEGIGIVSKSGRYGGTYAHPYISYNFANWLSPVFYLNFVTEFDRLKIEEAKQIQQDWNASRFLSKIGLSLQNEIIKTDLVPRLDGKEKIHAYATEADLLNLVVFKMTAKEYRERFPAAKGNLRDQANELQLIVLNSLESINAYLIKSGASYQARINQLDKIAGTFFEILSEDKRLRE